MAEAMLNAALYNEALYGEGASDTLYTTDHPRFSYFLDARDDSGDRLAWLPSYASGKYKQAVNKPSTLSFSYPADEDEAAYLCYPNQVWLHDSAGNTVEKFHITQVDESAAVGEAVVSVQCESLIRQLADEWIIDYEATPGDNKTIKEIVTDWLASTGTQTHASPIQYGWVTSSIGSLQRNFYVKKKTILQALLDLLATVDPSVAVPYMYVRPSTRGLYILSHLGDNTGQRIRYGKNLAGITKSEDPSELITRLYVYGKNGLDLTDAGESDPYLDDATAQATYGIRTFVLEQGSIEDADTLLAFAQAVLERRNAPRITYSVNAVDLSKTQRLDFDFEKLRLGSVVRVTNDTPAVDVETTVREISVDIGNPLALQLALENDAQDSLENVIADIVERLGDPGGSVSVDTDTTPELVDVGGLGSAGSSTDAAPIDHEHGLAETAFLSDETPEAVASAGSAGTGTKASRDDHVHQVKILEYTGP